MRSIKLKFVTKPFHSADVPRTVKFLIRLFITYYYLSTMAVLRVCLGILLLTSMLNAIESSHNRLRHEKGSPELRKRRLSDIVRRRRASESKSKRAAYYNPWTPPNMVRTPPNRKPSFTLWQPNQVQIQRPYYIPIWGPPGKPPIYFPPQPIYLNPGLPLNNRYLPPAGENTTVPTDNKFGEDGPIWGTVNEPATVPPTRKPRPPVTHPPIVRPADSETTNNEITPSREPVVENQPPAPSIGNQPSRCVWAIISCCSASSNTVSYDCFEQLGCNGAFWDNSPCDSEIARAAISTAMNYYQTR
ncbi:uncharacterized protein LOC116167343 isoform X1 [Photinus pyralis]|uniref:uncharacterized protein LOC116167343 isoform X1 n=1 Tax=Photinus pyralis TaxID=7054 RepID=UPI00126718D5|nr:uncharacterized protein LOC116167343 isoform X1 [Photinus pyralis]